MVQGQLFKEYIFNFLKKSVQGLSFLHLEIALLFRKSRYTSKEKVIFFCHHNFLKVNK